MKLKIHKDQLEQLSVLLKVEKGSKYEWLGYTLELETGKVDDLLNPEVHHNETEVQVWTTLLTHYILAKPTVGKEKLVKFKDLPGGYAYERAFLQRVVNPIAQAFGEKPQELLEAAMLLKGKQLALGDISVEIPALEGIPIVYIVWGKTEFPATASVLFDESADNFLPTEDLAVLAELTTSRLIKAQSNLKKQN
jgi:hypothetical protein